MMPKKSENKLFVNFCPYFGAHMQQEESINNP